jgi:hypothetical protein
MTGLIPIYRCHPFQAHGLNVCEVRVEIPFDPMVLSKGASVGREVDNTVEKMAHVALTPLCECSLTATGDTPIALFLIRNQEEPEWQQCHEVICDLTISHFSAGWAHMVKYLRYLFNLQHNTEQVTLTS